MMESLRWAASAVPVQPQLWAASAMEPRRRTWTPTIYQIDDEPLYCHYADERERRRRPPSEPLSKSLVGQGICAGVASCFQVYSGGIAIDTVSTRLQARWGWRAAFYGDGGGAAAAASFRPAQLFAGHSVVAFGRFPYLFVSLGAYAQTEKACVALRADEATVAERRLSGVEEAACVASSTLLGAGLITMVEAPKVIAQLGGGCHHTCASVARDFGVSRLFAGYDACCLREGCFQTALFFAPAAAARALKADGEALSAAEEMATSLCAGAAAGFLSNPFDQLKTRIQAGESPTLREAWRWQLRAGGGLRPLLGTAAVARAFYTAHAVLAVNFVRFRVEGALDDRRWS